jgi:hypothetical protein
MVENDPSSSIAAEQVRRAAWRQVTERVGEISS